MDYYHLDILEEQTILKFFVSTQTFLDGHFLVGTVLKGHWTLHQNDIFETVAIDFKQHNTSKSSLFATCKRSYIQFGRRIFIQTIKY